ncbi:hypothetical protein SK128_020705 [Halocaridina rubra]|uniref:Uncharacterized protein n=1 Tax=Halocaridina rubra TaxID=373956 RepID=A0AAN9A930_HALRR
MAEKRNHRQSVLMMSALKEGPKIEPISFSDLNNAYTTRKLCSIPICNLPVLVGGMLSRNAAASTTEYTVNVNSASNPYSTLATTVSNSPIAASPFSTSTETTDLISATAKPDVATTVPETSSVSNGSSTTNTITTVSTTPTFAAITPAVTYASTEHITKSKTLTPKSNVGTARGKMLSVTATADFGTTTPVDTAFKYATTDDSWITEQDTLPTNAFFTSKNNTNILTATTPDPLDTYNTPNISRTDDTWITISDTNISSTALKTKTTTTNISTSTSDPDTTDEYTDTDSTLISVSDTAPTTTTLTTIGASTTFTTTTPDPLNTTNSYKSTDRTWIPESSTTSITTTPTSDITNSNLTATTSDLPYTTIPSVTTDDTTTTTILFTATTTKIAVTTPDPLDTTTDDEITNNTWITLPNSTITTVSTTIITPTTTSDHSDRSSDPTYTTDVLTSTVNSTKNSAITTTPTQLSTFIVTPSRTTIWPNTTPTEFSTLIVTSSGTTIWPNTTYTPSIKTPEPPTTSRPPTQSPMTPEPPTTPPPPTTLEPPPATSSTTTTTPRPIVPPPDCQAEYPFPVLYPNYIWESAKPGENTTKACPPGSDSTNSSATRFCNALGNWTDLPNLRKCRNVINNSAYFRKCRNVITDGILSELNDTNSNATAGETLDTFVRNITNTTLGSGDVINLVNVLDAAKERHKRDVTNITDSGQILNITNTYTNSVTKMSSKVLEDATVWEGLPRESRFETGSNLQENLKEAAVEVSLLLNEARQTYSYTSLSVIAQQFNSNYYDNEENRTFSHPLDESNKIQLPDNFYDSLPDNGQVAVSFTAYNTLHCVMSGGAVCGRDKGPDRLENVDESTESDVVIDGLVNSRIIGLTVGRGTWNASEGSEVLINFNHFLSRDVYNLTESQCVWWDSKTQSWLEDGCRLVQESASGTTCACDHLTNLAVIMDVNGKLPNITIHLICNSFHKKLVKEVAYWITIIGCSLSLTCLLLALLTLGSYIRKTRDVPRYNTLINLHFCGCLFITEIVLLAGLDRRDKTDAGCGIVAGLLHYLLLVTFCWMGVESLNFYRLLIKVFPSGKSPMKFYCLFAYGTPALIVGISAAATKGRGYGTEE